MGASVAIARLLNLGMNVGISKSQRKNSMPQKGYKHTKTTKKKISEAMRGKVVGFKFKKGNTPWNKGKKGVQKSKWKGKTIPYLKKYQFKKGKKHPKWRGGVCRDKHYLGKKEYRLWRKAVFERDNYTCQICGEKGGQLEAHHIFSWADYPGLRFNIQNGMTVHKKCHPK